MPSLTPSPTRIEAQGSDYIDSPLAPATPPLTVNPTDLSEAQPINAAQGHKGHRYNAKILKPVLMLLEEHMALVHTTTDPQQELAYLMNAERDCQEVRRVLRECHRVLEIRGYDLLREIVEQRFEFIRRGDLPVYEDMIHPIRLLLGAIDCQIARADNATTPGEIQKCISSLERLWDPIEKICANSLVLLRTRWEDLRRVRWISTNGYLLPELDALGMYDDGVYRIP